MRLLPGDYLGNIRVSSGSMLVVGTGAHIDAQDTAGVFTVLQGADVTIRGLSIYLDHGSLFCGGGTTPTDPGGILRLRDLTVAVRSSYTLDMIRCMAVLRRVNFIGGGRHFVLRDSSSFDGDRLRFTGDGGNYPLLMGLATTLTIKNSVFDGVLLTLDPQDTGATTSRALIAYNIFYTGSATLVLYRQPTATNLSTTIENNILVSAAPSATSAVVCPAPDCIVAHNVVFPQATVLPPSNIIMDPKMVNAAMGDFHPRSDSPAVNGAVPSGPGATDHDFAGGVRPQGAAPDIGAYEFVP